MLTDADRRYYREARKLGWTATGAMGYVKARRLFAESDRVRTVTWALEYDPIDDPSYADVPYALVLLLWPEPTNAWRSDDAEVIGTLGGVADESMSEEDPWIVTEAASLLDQWLWEQARAEDRRLMASMHG